MNSTLFRAAAVTGILAALAVVFVVRRAPPAPPSMFTADLLPAVRRAATMVPGELATDVAVLELTKFRRLASLAAEGAPDDSVPSVRAVFQVRFPSGWIMIDAGLDKAFDPQGRTPTDEAYAMLQAALRGATLNVLTHEHQDHSAGIVRSPYRDELERNTLLTRAQVHTLVTQPEGSLIRLDSAVASRFLVVDYDPLFPIAPGVVLIKAAGHTPGSQMIYVRLTSGAELLFAGDVSVLMSAVMQGQQRPPRPDVQDDRRAIAPQLDWLRDMSQQGLAVVLAHDDTTLTQLKERGLIHSTIDTVRK